MTTVDHYTPPRTPGGDAWHIPPGAFEAIRGFRPWVRFLSIVAFVASGFHLFAGVMTLRASSSWALAMDAVVDPSEHDPRHLTVPFSFGRLHLSFFERPLEGEVPLQGWVTAILSAEGLYSVNTRAVRLDSACAPATAFASP